jgi:hypothetical protein
VASAIPHVIIDPLEYGSQLGFHKSVVYPPEP